MTKSIASLSLDLDNHWSYLRSRGDASWEKRPSYLPEVVPRIIDFLGERNLPCTFFVVGEDCDRDEDCCAIESLAVAGHEIANHSQSHLPWMDSLPREELEAQVLDAHEAIERVTGKTPIGFRAPGFSWTEDLFQLLVKHNYKYDCSHFPTFIGPIAQLYCKLSGGYKNNGSTPKQRFSSLSDALKSLKPYHINTKDGSLVELPVTTMPIARVPIHFTYISFLAQKSPWTARAYWNLASKLCRLRGVGPSLLLHPLDFMGVEDLPDMADFPGMQLPREDKLNLLSDVLERLAKSRSVVSVANHALSIEKLSNSSFENPMITTSA